LADPIINQVMDSNSNELFENQYVAAQNRVEFNPDAPYENKEIKEEQIHFSIVPL